MDAEAHQCKARSMAHLGLTQMNIAATTPAHVAGFVLTVLLFVTLIAMPRSMSTTQPTHHKRHIAFLISSSVPMSFLLIIIMIDIAALI